jgi:hypothetical protein
MMRTRCCRVAYPKTESLLDRVLARLTRDIPLRDRLKNAVSLNRVSENLVVSAAGAQAPGA